MGGKIAGGSKPPPYIAERSRPFPAVGRGGYLYFILYYYSIREKYML